MGLVFRAHSRRAVVVFAALASSSPMTSRRYWFFSFSWLTNDLEEICVLRFLLASVHTGDGKVFSTNGWNRIESSMMLSVQFWKARRLSIVRVNGTAIGTKFFELKLKWQVSPPLLQARNCTSANWVSSCSAFLKTCQFRRETSASSSPMTSNSIAFLACSSANWVSEAARPFWRPASFGAKRRPPVPRWLPTALHSWLAPPPTEFLAARPFWRPASFGAKRRPPVPRWLPTALHSWLAPPPTEFLAARPFWRPASFGAKRRPPVPRWLPTAFHSWLAPPPTEFLAAWPFWRPASFGAKRRPPVPRWLPTALHSWLAPPPTEFLAARPFWRPASFGAKRRPPVPRWLPTALHSWLAPPPTEFL